MVLLLFIYSSEKVRFISSSCNPSINLNSLPQSISRPSTHCRLPLLLMYSSFTACRLNHRDTLRLREIKEEPSKYAHVMLPNSTTSNPHGSNNASAVARRESLPDERVDGLFFVCHDLTVSFFHLAKCSSYGGK